MYAFLLVLHSLIRWVVLICLCYSIFRAFNGLRNKSRFTKRDNAWRHWTATAGHLQLIIGFILYTISPIVIFFWTKPGEGINYLSLTFYGIIHISIMFLAIVVLTIGSALAKRKKTDREQFKTMLIWFSIALLIILIAIPWPFSPLSARPLIRLF